MPSLSYSNRTSESALYTSVLRVFTLSMDAIIPLRGCSPVGSTQVNLGPKSVKTDLEDFILGLCMLLEVMIVKNLYGIQVLIKDILIMVSHALTEHIICLRKLK